MIYSFSCKLLDSPTCVFPPLSSSSSPSLFFFFSSFFFFFLLFSSFFFFFYFFIIIFFSCCSFKPVSPSQNVAGMLLPNRHLCLVVDGWDTTVLAKILSMQGLAFKDTDTAQPGQWITRGYLNGEHMLVARFQFLCLQPSGVTLRMTPTRPPPWLFLDEDGKVHVDVGVLDLDGHNEAYMIMSVHHEANGTIVQGPVREQLRLLVENVAPDAAAAAAAPTAESVAAAAAAAAAGPTVDRSQAQVTSAAMEAAIEAAGMLDAPPMPKDPPPYSAVANKKSSEAAAAAAAAAGSAMPGGKRPRSPAEPDEPGNKRLKTVADTDAPTPAGSVTVDFNDPSLQLFGALSPAQLGLGQLAGPSPTAAAPPATVVDHAFRNGQFVFLVSPESGGPPRWEPATGLVSGLGVPMPSYASYIISHFPHSKYPALNAHLLDPHRKPFDATWLADLDPTLVRAGAQ